MKNELDDAIGELKKNVETSVERRRWMLMAINDARIVIAAYTRIPFVNKKAAKNWLAKWGRVFDNY